MFALFRPKVPGKFCLVPWLSDGSWLWCNAILLWQPFVMNHGGLEYFRTRAFCPVMNQIHEKRPVSTGLKTKPFRSEFWPTEGDFCPNMAPRSCLSASIVWRRIKYSFKINSNQFKSIYLFCEELFIWRWDLEEWFSWHWYQSIWWWTMWNPWHWGCSTPECWSCAEKWRRRWEDLMFD